MVDINPREVACDAITEIMEEGAYNNMTLRRALRQNGAMSKVDRAMVTELVNGTLRNLYYIDYVLDIYSKTKTEKLKPWILTVLRTAVYQMLFMKIPDAAACNEAVKLTAKRGLSQLKGFVNGVLRTVSRERDNIPLPEKGTAEYLHILYSHPLWLVKMWIAYYGYEETEKLLAANNLSPDVTVRVNTIKTDRDSLKGLLEEKGIQVREGGITKNSLHLKKTADIAKLDAFKRGLFHVQDESSQLAAEALAPCEGDNILDVCAAPGGKSFTAAEKINNTGNIISCDIYEHKTEFIAEGAKRLGLTNIKVLRQDATVRNEAFVDSFDKVLADAPCSCLGLIKKKPDIRLKKNGDEIDSLVSLQREILNNAAVYVKKGGVLLYSTCTLSKKENEKNIEWFLASHGNFVADNIKNIIPEGIDNSTAEKGYVTLFPHKTNTDGFFIARMIRKE